MRADQFSQSLEMLDNGCLPDSAADAEDVLLMLAQHYAYVFPGDSTLAMLAGLGPLVEIGAGTGYWAHRLRSIGVDIVAFDQAPLDGERTNRYHSHTRPWTHVEQGDQTVLSGYADRGLFLCWPPLFSSLGDCLTYYCGDTVAYIGDGGYRTARLDRLHEAFTKVATAPVRALDPFPGVRPQLTIWKRRSALIAAHGSLADVDLTCGKLGSYATTHEISVDGPLREYYLRGVTASSPSRRARRAGSSIEHRHRVPERGSCGVAAVLTGDHGREPSRSWCRLRHACAADQHEAASRPDIFRAACLVRAHEPRDCQGHSEYVCGRPPGAAAHDAG